MDPACRAIRVLLREPLCAQSGYTMRSPTGMNAHAPSLSLSPSPLSISTAKELWAAFRHIALRDNAALTIFSFSVSKKSA